MIDFTLWGQGLIQSYGLIGLFIISIITNSSVLVILPGWVFVVAAGSVFNPFLVAIVAALGSTIGEFTSYFLGRGGNYIIEKKGKIPLDLVKGWFKQHGFLLFPVFAALPLPMDLLGIVAGTVRYDTKKFFLGVFIGKFVKCLVLAYLGYQGIQILGLV